VQPNLQKFLNDLGTIENPPLDDKGAVNPDEARKVLYSVSRLITSAHPIIRSASMVHNKAVPTLLIELELDPSRWVKEEKDLRGDIPF